MRHRTAIQKIPALTADICAHAPDLSIRKQLAQLLEEKIAFMHLRGADLPYGRKLIAAIEYGAIAQSILSAGPPGPFLPYSSTLEPGDLARAGWLWKARDSARVASNLGDNTPDTRDWLMFLLNLHLARSQYAAWALARLHAQTPDDSISDGIALRLATLLNELLLADFDELQQFLSGAPVQITAQDVSRYHATSALLLRKRNLLLAIVAHPFLQNQLGTRDFWRRLPRDAEDLLAPGPGRLWAPIIRKIEEAGRSEDVLAAGLGVSTEVIRSLSRGTSDLLAPHVLDRLISLLRHLDPNLLPRNDGDFLKIMFLAGLGDAHGQSELFSAMSERISHADDLTPVKRWLSRYSRFTNSLASFACVAESLLWHYRFNLPAGSARSATSLFAFLGEPTFKELDSMLLSWTYIDKHVREWMRDQFGVHPLMSSMDELEECHVPETLGDRSALPDATAGTALWFFSLASMIACFPGGGYEESSVRALLPGPDRGLAAAALCEVLNILAAR